MDSFVLRWRAVWWGRVWGSVAVLTLAWSIGAGLAVRAVTPNASIPSHAEARYCEPSAPRPLIASPADLRTLPLRAFIAAPLGLYVSGLQFAAIAFLIVLIPAARLQQGTARRVLSARVIGLLAVMVVAGGWSFELEETARTNTLPALTCSN
ncbi:MAG TPA: hypothetical protein VN224_08970 [Xanthomonadales bacterium]|nr:hypothetical protein [Xanthomonadales bacterium]